MFRRLYFWYNDQFGGGIPLPKRGDADDLVIIYVHFFERAPLFLVFRFLSFSHTNKARVRLNNYCSRPLNSDIS